MAERILAVADSDSYLKWAAGLLDDLPPSWERRLVVVRTPIAPSPPQVTAAVSGTGVSGCPPEVLPAQALRRLVRREVPDVVLLACTGPVVDLLATVTLAGLSPRPVLVSGLPGISVPATRKAWLFRSAVDLFVVHSRREVDEFTTLGRALGAYGRVGLARLPSLSGGAPPTGTKDPTRHRVVFASQAKVPAGRADRVRVLRALATLAERRPDLEVVVKLRSEASERQTHRERHHYRTLWDELVAAGEVPVGAVVFETGAMRAHLARAAGFVTVSSTAALEAIDAGVPLLVLADFGVSGELFNLVFTGSGCLGTLTDLVHADFRTPDAEWRAGNYFHDRDATTWLDLLDGLLAASRAGTYAPPASLLRGPVPTLRRTRARARLAVGPRLHRAAVTATQQLTRPTRRLRRTRPQPHPDPGGPMEWRHTLWPEARTVYTATPKVANTSVKAALLRSFRPDAPRRNPHREDMPYEEVPPDEIRCRYADYLHFAVVRDPYDRFVSFYTDRVVGTGFGERMERLGFSPTMSFGEAAALASTLPDRRTDPHMRSQSYLLVDRRGRMRPDLLLRFERMPQDWSLLTLLAKERTGQVLGDLPRRRVSERRERDAYYDETSRALVRDRYRADFERLGYPTRPDAPADRPPYDPVLDRIVGALDRGGRRVLDLTTPSPARAETVESRGGYYLGLTGTSPVGQLTDPDALRHGRVPESLFDVLVVPARDTRLLGGHLRWLRTRFESTGRTVVTP